MEELNLALLLLRVVAGVTLALHGYQKFFMGGRLKGTAGWFESLGMKPGKLHALLAACTEISCGLGLAAGLLTPLTAAGLVGIMVVAAWTHKQAFFVFKDGYEYNLVLAVVAVAIATIGPGEWSLDHAFGIDDDLDGWLGLGLSAGLGVGASVGLLLVFWRPPVKEPAA
jgi:putative oxidoreductase